MSDEYMLSILEKGVRNGVFPRPIEVPGYGPMVILASTAQTMANVVRAMRLGKVKRSGRKGKREWTISPLNPAEMPKRPVARKK